MTTVNRRTRWLFALLGLLLLGALIAVPSARAFESRGGDTVTIGPDEVIQDDLYVGAGEFTLEGTIEGDLVVFGGTLRINGTVEGDLIAAGQSVIVNGSVGDDARIAGYALVIQGSISDDLVAAGFSLEADDASSIGGDVVYAGYQALLASEVGGELNVSGGAVRIAGTIEGDARVDVGGTERGETVPPFYNYIPSLPSVPSVPAGLTLTEAAQIGGDLTYTANFRADVPDDAVAGQTDFNRYVPEREEEREPSPVALVARWLFRQLRRLVTLLVVGVLLMWILPNWMRNLADNVEERPLPSFGWGVVAIAAFVVFMVLLALTSIALTLIFGAVTLGGLAGLFATLGGVVTTTAGLAFGLMWRYVTTIIIALLLGQMIFGALDSQAEGNRWWPMLLGVAIIVIVTAVPILGWLVKLAIVLFGLGAIWIWGLRLLRGEGTRPTAAEA
jgi:cytoskeletal protein CcmA (bactofilin family)